MRLLSNDPTLFNSTIEECLRFECPGQYIKRIALDDIALNGITIKKGSVINLIIGAANRDPEIFNNPNIFDIKRNPNPHLSFGHGHRRCMGFRFAIDIASIGLKTLIHNFGDLSLKSEKNVEWETSFRVHGIKSLPLFFEILP